MIRLGYSTEQALIGRLVARVAKADGVSSKFVQFLEEEGDKLVTNPDTGRRKVKVRSLRMDKGKQLKKKMFQDWLKKDKDKGEEGEKEKEDKGGEKEDKAEGAAAKDPSMDKPVENFDPEKHKPPADGMPAKDGPVKEVQDEAAAGKPPLKKKVVDALMLVTRAMAIPTLKDNQLDAMHSLERWLRDMAGMGPEKEKATGWKPPVKREKASPLSQLQKKHKLKPDDVGAIREYAKSSAGSATHDKETAGLKKKYKLESRVIKNAPAAFERAKKKLESDYVKAKKKFDSYDSDMTKYEAQKKKFDDGKLTEEPEKPEKSEEPKKPTDATAREVLKKKMPELAEVDDKDLDTLTAPTDKKKSKSERLKEFLATVKDPEMKKRVQEMDPDDFGEFIAAIGKQASVLRVATIRMAYVKPEIRTLLIPLVMADVS